MALTSIPNYPVSGMDQTAVSAALLVPQTGTATLFTVTGAVHVLEIWGVITAAASATATNLKVSVQVGTLTAVDVCANGAIASLAIGQLLGLKTSLATALVVAAPTTNGVMDATADAATSFMMSGSGIITATTSASNATCTVRWFCRYRPLTAGALVV